MSLKGGVGAEPTELFGSLGTEMDHTSLLNENGNSKFPVFGNLMLLFLRIIGDEH